MPEVGCGTSAWSVGSKPARGGVQRGAQRWATRTPQRLDTRAGRRLARQSFRPLRASARASRLPSRGACEGAAHHGGAIPRPAMLVSAPRRPVRAEIRCAWPPRPSGATGQSAPRGGRQSCTAFTGQAAAPRLSASVGASGRTRTVWVTGSSS